MKTSEFKIFWLSPKDLDDVFISCLKACLFVVVSFQFLENCTKSMMNRKVDYVIINQTVMLFFNVFEMYGTGREQL